MERITLHISGMMCSACVANVERALSAVPGVSKARVNLAKKSARVAFDEQRASRADLVRAVEDAGYTVSDEAQPGNSPAKVAAIALAAVAIWLIVSILGFDLSGTDFPLATSGMGYGMLFVVGVLTSFHCVAMCGGINISQCMPAGAATNAGAESKTSGEAIVRAQSSDANEASAEAEPGESKMANANDLTRSAKPRRKRPSFAAFKPTLLYNVGRVASYTVIGTVVGALGATLSLSLAARSAIQLIAGVFMLLMALSMLGLVPGVATLLARVKAAVGKVLPKKRDDASRTGATNAAAEASETAGSTTSSAPSSKRPRRVLRGPLIVGLLSGFMPCGPLQAMQLYALGSGSALAGGASMLCFALGTVPLMLGLGAVAGSLSRHFARKAMTAGACVVMVMGLFMTANGWALAGLPSVQLPNAGQAIAGVLGGSCCSSGSQTTSSCCASGASSQSGCCASGNSASGNDSTSSGSSSSGNSSSSGSTSNSNGSNSSSSSSKKSASGATATMGDGVQTVETTLSGGYTPITVVAGTPVKWTISATKKTLTSCNRTIEIPEFDIEKTLSAGDNVIEFTPTKAGTFTYTCWMGMIRSTITVTEA